MIKIGEREEQDHIMAGDGEWEGAGRAAGRRKLLGAPTATLPFYFVCKCVPVGNCHKPPTEELFSTG